METFPTSKNKIHSSQSQHCDREENSDQLCKFDQRIARLHCGPTINLRPYEYLKHLRIIYLFYCSSYPKLHLVLYHTHIRDRMILQSGIAFTHSFKLLIASIQIHETLFSFSFSCLAYSHNKSFFLSFFSYSLSLSVA